MNFKLATLLCATLLAAGCVSQQTYNTEVAKANTLTTANQHRWAEALDKQLTHALLQNLRQQLPDWQWQNGQMAGQNIAQLQVKIRGFHGKADGHGKQGDLERDQSTVQHLGQSLERLIPMKIVTEHCRLTLRKR